MSEYFQKHSIRTFPAGTVIFKEGDLGFSMFIIQRGQVEITTKVDGQTIILAVLGEGEIFGEMALLGDSHRSASVTAVRNTMCLEINKLLFNKQMESVAPWMKAFFRILVERLKDANKKRRTLTPKDLSRQVVYLVSDFLERVEENKSGQRQIPWLKTVEDIVFLLNLPKEQVEKVMNQLTITELAQSKIVFGNQRVLVSDKMSDLRNFSKFLKKRHFEKMGTSLPEEYVGCSEEEMIFLDFLKELMKNQANATDLHLSDLEIGCQEKFQQPLTIFEHQFKELTDMGILHPRVDSTGDKYYIVDREQMNKRLEKANRISSYKNLENRLG
ncbi:MAG TPA: cyclic nucleotide-binding domain-containing protein [Candidatus Marinimicrobia bacterium]|nr:cyclic nucleotide-binding domain-containing protein [Candidatus Neomarinimicrobiota bacterium]